MDPENLTPGQTDEEQWGFEEPTGGSQEPLCLLDMLSPGSLCLEIFISAQQLNVNGEPLPFFVPLVVFSIMGLFISFTGFLYALFKKMEGSKRSLRRQPAEVERVKFMWMKVGWLFVVIALVLSILLPLRGKALTKVLPGVIIGLVTLVHFFHEP